MTSTLSTIDFKLVTEGTFLFDHITIKLYNVVFKRRARNWSLSLGSRVLMGCFCSKQRPQIFEDPSLLASQSRCNGVLFVYFLIIILFIYSIKFATAVTPKEVKKLNELFRKLGSTLVDDGFLNRVICS